MAEATPRHELKPTKGQKAGLTDANIYLSPRLRRRLQTKKDEAFLMG